MTIPCKSYHFFTKILIKSTNEQSDIHKRRVFSSLNSDDLLFNWIEWKEKEEEMRSKNKFIYFKPLIDMHISNFWVKNFSECFTALYLYVRLSCQPGTLFRLFGIFCMPFYWYKVAKTEYNWNSRRWRTIPHHFQLPSRFLSLKQKQMHTDDILNLYPLFLSFFFIVKSTNNFRYSRCCFTTSCGS